MLMKKKAALGILSMLLVAASVVAMATDANAQRRRHNGAGVAAGIIGGLAAGAIIGGALSQSRPAYAYPAYRAPRGYVAYDGYYAAAPVGCPGGHWRRRPVAFDRFGNPVAWSKPRFVCP